jgi:hypothetical protein
MRRLLVPLLFIAAAFPALGFADRGAPDGTLAVRDGRGKVQLANVKGSLIGRLGNGSLMIEELAPDEGTEPVVRGYKTFKWGRNSNVRTYTGKNIRFRLIGGRYRVVFNGKGLFFSLVGRGRVQLDGIGSLTDGIFYDGFYSLNGSEEESLPDEPTWMLLSPPPPPPPPSSSRPSPSG